MCSCRPASCVTRRAKLLCKLQSEQVTPLRTKHSQPKKLRAAQILLGWRHRQPKLERERERERGTERGRKGGRASSTHNSTTCATRHGTTPGLVSPLQAATVVSSPQVSSLPLCGSSLELRVWRLWPQRRVRATSCKASFSSTNRAAGYDTQNERFWTFTKLGLK